MSFSLKKYLAFAALALLLGSCASRSKIVYLQDIEKNSSYEASKTYEAVIQPDDLLGIMVSSVNPEVAAPFNMISGSNSNSGSTGTTGSSDGQQQNNNGLKSYLVDNSGFIDFPVLGKVKLAGLSKSEANAFMVKKISEYITEPTVTMRIMNYKISVLGEVASRGQVEVKGERVTILDALAAAGDLTIYGRRDNILVIREVEGKKTYNRINLGKSDFMDSPFYYLAQNDVIYVEPNKTKVNSSVIGSDISVWVSLTSLAVTVITLIIVRF